MRRLLEALLRSRSARRVVSALLHIAFICGTNYAAFWLRFDGDIPPRELTLWASLLLLLIACRVVAFLPFRLFEGLWRYTSLWDLRSIVYGVGLSSLLFYAIVHGLFGIFIYPRSVFVVDAVLLICAMSGVRLSTRMYRETFVRPGRKRVLIFGAGDAGNMIVRDMRQNVEYDATPVGFLDDDPHKVGHRIQGVPVLGTRDHAAAIVSKYRADELLIAVPSASPQTMRGIVRALETCKIRISTLPSLHQLMGSTVGVNEIRSLRVEDLLSRPPVGLSRQPLKQLIEGRRVLVTGAGGSIGSEICRQVAGLGAARLVALDQYENTLFAVLNDLADESPGVETCGVIANVTDARRIRDVFDLHRPEIVFHAAAHKHVPLMEDNPCEAVKNNVRGSRTVAEAADAFGTGRFILISTDKAVNPTSVMGATKRVAELIVQAMGHRSKTRFVSVRFGNVLGSNGSVVPRFLEQIRRGGPVTVTHPRMKRFFMLIPEAVQLVLHAATLDEAGCTYALEMGEQALLVDLARDLIRLSGFIPEQEIPITFVGLRPGEKLEEELVGDHEIAEPSSIEKILRLRSTAGGSGPDVLATVARLEDAAYAGDVDRTLQLLCALVPNFLPTRQSITV